MSDFASLPTDPRRPLPSRPKRIRGALAREARMIGLWLWTPIAVGLQSMLRFVLRPGGNLGTGPGQFPGIDTLGEAHEALEIIAEWPAPERPSPIPGPSRPDEGVRPALSKRRMVRIFHAARHPED